MRLHHLPSYQFISQHKVDCNESLHGSCLHETSPVITNAKAPFGFRFGLKSTQTPVVWIHLSDFKGPSATFKNPQPSETHKHAHTDPGAVARRGGTAHWGEANSLLWMPATFLQLHCHIASLLTRHYLGSCYCTALPGK